MDSAARALGEPRRRAILRLVRDDERSVGDIADHFEVSRPAISQHLRVLAEADLVTIRSEGTSRFYRARPEGMAELREWLDGFWPNSLHQLATEAEKEHMEKRKKK